MEILSVGDTPRHQFGQKESEMSELTFFFERHFDKETLSADLAGIQRLTVAKKTPQSLDWWKKIGPVSYIEPELFNLKLYLDYIEHLRDFMSLSQLFDSGQKGLHCNS